MQTAVQPTPSAASAQAIDYKFFGLCSVAVWVLSTLDLRLWGQHFFIVSNPLLIDANFLFSLVALPLLVYGLIRVKNVPPYQRLAAVLTLTIPSMLLDVPTTYFFAQSFPNLSPAANGAFGAWLLWGYAISLLTGVIMSQPTAELKRQS